jgi:UDP-glucose 4-epimerase
LIINIGNGKGITIKEILIDLQKILQKKINYKFLKKRKGDHPYLICNISKAKTKINWEPKYSKVRNILRDEIKWSKYLIKNNFLRKLINVQK